MPVATTLSQGPSKLEQMVQSVLTGQLLAEAALPYLRGYIGYAGKQKTPEAIAAALQCLNELYEAGDDPRDLLVQLDELKDAVGGLALADAWDTVEQEFDDDWRATSVGRIQEAEEEWESVENVFCPTGEGGGVDATCSPGGEKSEAVQEKRNSIVRAVLEKVDKVLFTKDAVGGNDKDPGDLSTDEIEDRMTEHEKVRMESALDRAAYEYADMMMEDYEADIDDTDIAADLGYDRGSISSKFQELIQEHIEEEERELWEGKVKEWEEGARRRDAGTNGIDGLISSLPPIIPTDLKNAIDEYRDEVESEVSSRHDDLEESIRDGTHRDYVNQYDSSEDRIQYLKDFLERNEDDPRFANTKQLDVWGSDASHPNDRLYNFETASGHGYEITATDETRRFALTDDPNPSYQHVKTIDFMFSDSAGNVHRTGAGSAVEVFKTVTTAITAMVKRENPDLITFCAADPSRQKLYDRLTKTVTTLFPEYAAFTTETPENRYRQYSVLKRPLVEPAKRFAEKHLSGGSSDNIRITPLVNQTLEELLCLV